MIPKRVLPALVLLLPALAFAQEPRSALDWLQRMSSATHTLNYEGRFVYQHDNSLISMELYHGVKGKEEKERLVSLDGASREVVREGGKVTCILPHNGSVMVEDRAPNTFFINVPVHPERLGMFYRMSVGDEERVAGNRARKITITPRDGYRYGQSMWLDRETGLLLKAELKDEKGNVVERFMFTSLKVHPGPLPDKLLEPQSSGKDLVWHSASEQKPDGGAVETDGWRLATVPAGFDEELRREHRLPGERDPAEQRVLSDGLASVSVFIEPAKGQQDRPRLLKKGALNAYMRYAEDHRITVLGDVPANTVRLIGDGVVFEKGEGRD